MCVRRPDVLDHYVVLESDGMEPLRTIFEGIDSKDAVIMISTRMPNNRWGITFQFHAAKTKTMVQIHDMSVAGVASEGGEITSHLDPVDWETSLLGSQDGLGGFTNHHTSPRVQAHYSAQKSHL